MIFRRSATPWSARSPRDAETAARRRTQTRPAIAGPSVTSHPCCSPHCATCNGENGASSSRSVSTAIIFGMTLVLTGLANGFRVEARRTVDSLGVDVFLVKAGASGPVSRCDAVRAVDLGRIAAAPGVLAAAPLRIRRRHGHAGRRDTQRRPFGAPEHGPGMPALSQGRRSRRSRTRSRFRARWAATMGDDIEIASRKLRIVGIVENSTAMAKLPNIFLTTEGCPATGVQRAAVGRVDRDSRHTSSSCPTATRAFDRDGAVDDLLRPLKVAVELDHDRGDPAVDRGGADRGIGGVPVRAGATARLRGVQGDRRTPTRSILAGLALQAHRGRAGRGVGRRRPRRQLLAPIFPMSRGGARPAPTWHLPVLAIVYRSVGQRSPDCVARWPSIPRSRSEVLNQWAISAFRTWSSSTHSGGYAVRPINGFNLDVAAGSLVILLGPSGCGKTTLLSCLGGILRPKSGRDQIRRRRHHDSRAVRRWRSTGATRSASSSRRSTSCRASPHSRT